MSCSTVFRRIKRYPTPDYSYPVSFMNLVCKPSRVFKQQLFGRRSFPSSYFFTTSISLDKNKNIKMSSSDNKQPERFGLESQVKRNPHVSILSILNRLQVLTTM